MALLFEVYFCIIAILVIVNLEDFMFRNATIVALGFFSSIKKLLEAIILRQGQQSIL